MCVTFDAASPPLGVHPHGHRWHAVGDHRASNNRGAVGEIRGGGRSVRAARVQSMQSMRPSVSEETSVPLWTHLVCLWKATQDLGDSGWL